MPAGKRNVGVNKARALRRKATEAEKRLRVQLRNRRLAGFKFRRQHPVDSYVLDFFCEEKSLAVELDGGGHGYADKKRHDGERDAFLAAEGIKVARFKNWEVMEELDWVTDRILHELDPKQSKWCEGVT